jgi:hypothetical protein
MNDTKSLENRASAMICPDCGQWQKDNLSHTCYACGGKLVNRFNEKGEPVVFKLEKRRTKE